MIEYELFTRMLSWDYLSSDQKNLIEPKQAGSHTCTIVDKGVDKYKAYRYDLDNCNFLPFFNKEHNDDKKGIVVENPTPEGLRKFCDYILLAVVKEKLYVILVEMKSGGNNGANQQLAASKTFIDYVKSSAERIKTICGYGDFDTKNIVVRKVLLKPGPKIRSTTNIGRRNNQINWAADPIVLYSQLFPLLKVCECHHR